MTKDKTKSTGQIKTDARQARLEKALRENLAKRKQQTRGRTKKDDV